MKGFRPTIARTVNSMQRLNSVKTNATIRNLDEEEGELEEKQGIVVSIRRDLINGAGWTVKDGEGNIYVCSCAASMYELPESTERRGILYPQETVEVIFTVNPVLRVNTIKEIKSSNNEKIDIGKFQHQDESTIVIAKPRSALSISDGLVTMNYDNNNQVTAGPNGVSTEGQNTNINTDKLNIESNDITIQGVPLSEIIGTQAIGVSNVFETFDVPTLANLGLIGDRSNNMTQLHLNGQVKGEGVIGEIKDQRSIPVREQQHMITDGNCIDIVTIDTDGIIKIQPAPNSPCQECRKLSSTINFITPQVESRNYIKVTVKQMCNSCDNGNNFSMEYVDYCPSCQHWNVLIDTGTSIRCNSCQAQYCQNCGENLSKSSTVKLKKYLDNYISAYGTTCKHCKEHLQEGTTKQYINYCPDCHAWGELYQAERIQDGESINVLKCICDAEYCSTCGINQDRYGLTLTDEPVQYAKYATALRKLKYVKDGA